VTQAPLDQVVPLVRRALKVLSDREVSPQLGLLKSTLLQLDSTFSERTSGAGSFRDFAEKLASAGHVVLRESGRTVLVEPSDRAHARTEEAPPRAVQEPVQGPATSSQPPPSSSNGARAADGVREVRRLFQSAQNPPRWPMYIRQAKQFLRNVDASFDERRYGFGNLVDLMRACQREGLFRIERDRQGVMRIFPGNVMQQPVEPVGVETDLDDDSRGNVAEAAEAVASEWQQSSRQPMPETELVEGDVVQEIDEPASVIDVQEAEPADRSQPVAESAPSSRRSRGRSRPRSQGEARQPRKAPEGGSSPRARKVAAKPRAPRPRTRIKDAPPTD
jgi:hypothetical protein